MEFCSRMTALLPKRIIPPGGTMAGWKYRFSILGVMFAIWTPVSSGQHSSDSKFQKSPSTIVSSLGKPVKMSCESKGTGDEKASPPDLIWSKDGVPLQEEDTDQYQSFSDNTWTVMSTLNIYKVQSSDMGSYRCAVDSEGNQTLSEKGRIQSEGLPYFSVGPEHMSVVAGVPLSLRCVAHGPPEPVRILWSRNGVPMNSLEHPMASSPSTLNLTGSNTTSIFSCEAYNEKGVTTSGSGTITVLPSPPHNVRAVEINRTSLRLSWRPGFGGVYPIIRCSVQVKQSGGSFPAGSDKIIYKQNVDIPPSDHSIRGSEPHTLYAVRVACDSSQGPSDWSPWVELRTQEGVPENPPANVTARPNGTEVSVRWEEPRGKSNGESRGYSVEYSTPSTEQFVVDAGSDSEVSLNSSVPSSNVSYRVCAYTGGGQGPWTPTQTSVLNSPETGKYTGSSNPPSFSWHWWYVVMGITGTVALAVLSAVYVAKSRRKETRFGEAFEPMMERGQSVVRYRARRSYSRRPLEATSNSLGISDESKQKSQDVMVDRHKLTSGKTSGEGEFGSVMEGSSNQEEAVLKVAVKTMKIAICTRSEMEDFSREAACMKEFDHPNVMRLSGVCSQTVESEGYPSPVVISPYMKHGDSHSYSSYSRSGDCPLYLPSQMSVKFMADIARGMEYLSSKNFIHRDLAARNCMSNENMNVCVADFGLSKKIYNGDYYRQGRISKMPVKWIAIESSADRVYTTKSDVWSFGVTMWEIATRGQTPYPGVENSEIYDYLRQGNRSKQPPDCLDSIYSSMFSCWSLSPKDRPSFETSRCESEKASEDSPDPQDPDEILYVNMDESSTELGAVGGRDPIGSSPSCSKGLESETTVEIHQTKRYVLCPQHDVTRTLSDSSETSDMPVSSSTATSPSQASCRTTPNRTPAPTPTFELQEDREATRRMPWQ